jgi:hypothetical protein
MKALLWPRFCKMASYKGQTGKKVGSICFVVVSKHSLGGTEGSGGIWDVWPSTDLATVPCTGGFVTNVLHVVLEDTFTDMYNMIAYLAPHPCKGCISSLHHISFECSMPGIHLCCQPCIISQLYSLSLQWIVVSFEPSFTKMWLCITAMSYLLVRMHFVMWR